MNKNKVVSICSYRTPAKVDIDIPVNNSFKMRKTVARAIVSSVKFVARFWSWFFVNMTMIGGAIISGLIKHPFRTAQLLVAINSIMLLIYAGYRAHKWAVQELKNIEGDKKY